jgi:hypothetical protein
VAKGPWTLHAIFSCLSLMWSVGSRMVDFMGTHCYTLGVSMLSACQYCSNAADGEWV